jgi:SulP family sulfate permease
VLRIESGLYFANADSIRARVLHAVEADNVRAVVIDAEPVPFVDVTAARMMLAALDDELRARHVRLLIARDIGQVRDILRHAIDDPALTRVYRSVQAAVDEAQRSPSS